MDSKEIEVDQRRRAFLRVATTVVGGVGVAAAALPFVVSMMPSAEAIAAGAPVKVSIGEMKPGEQLTVNWRGRPVWIIRRTKAMLETLTTQADLRDADSEVEQQPGYAKNRFRSRRPEYLVMVGLCTHLGCSPTYRPDKDGVEEGWQGGFYCACHGSKFDLSGRVFKGVPAPINLEIPPHVFLSETELLIGVDDKNEVLV